MDTIEQTGRSEGKPGVGKCVNCNPPGWLGVRGSPDSPMSGGGPGRFADQGIELDAQTGLRKPLGAHDGAMPMDDKEPPKPPNAPPATNVRQLGTKGVLLEKTGDLYDVKITAEVVADNTTTNKNVAAHTDFTIPASKMPKYESVEGKITKFIGKVTWKGNIKIQTTYGPGTNASSLSCYGRGTTDDDIASRDITLGFHENCHREDYAAYLAANALPEPPEITIGMDSSEYDTLADQWSKDILAYKPEMQADSDSKTDDVGYTKDTWKSSGQCYEHELPPEEE